MCTKQDLALIAQVQPGQTICITTREIIVQGGLYEWWLYWRWGHRIGLTAAWLSQLVRTQLRLYQQSFNPDKHLRQLKLLDTLLIALLSTYADQKTEWNLFFPIWQQLHNQIYKGETSGE